MLSFFNRLSWLCTAPAALSFAALLSLGWHTHSYAQGRDAHASVTPRARIVLRQNLHEATSGKADSKHQIRVALRDGTNLSSDVVIKRKSSPETEIQPPGRSDTLVSEAVYVQDLDSSTVLYDKSSTDIRPIASISKLMMALVVIESGLSMDTKLKITDADVDRMRYSRSRLSVGSELSRADMLHLALMSSENRASHALGRYHPGGMPAFVRAMNDKARALGMRHTHFVEPTGLSADNVSSARDLVKLAQAAAREPLIRRYSTSEKYDVTPAQGRQLAFRNSNRLVRNDKWDIQLSKTGFINEAGECLVMLTRIDNRDVAIVLLNASPRSRIADAIRIRSLVLKNADLAML